MASLDQPLPLPVAVLRRRAFNAKSAKDRHDSAYFAWEVSVRLTATFAHGADPKPLAGRGLGAWARAVPATTETLGVPALRAVAVLLGEEGRGQALTLRQTHARAILDVLPAYRNRVMGHGSVREHSFYAKAADVLLGGLDAAWRAGLFFPEGTKLVRVESIEVAGAGRRLARVFDLSGEAPLVLDPAGTRVTEAVEPGRLYAMREGPWVCLYPWLLHLDHSGRERVLCFDSIERGRARYLDYASGETLSGSKLKQLFPGVTQAVTDALSDTPSDETSDDAPAAEDGKRFGDFRILGKLGQGAMGTVYLARQESLGRLTALKILPRDMQGDSVSVARFQREVEAISRCEHPNVINILTYGELDGTHYYAMEYVEGAPLSAVGRALGTSRDLASAISTASEKIRTGLGEPFVDLPRVTSETRVTLPGRDRNRDIAALVRDAAHGLHQFHEAGVIHRDIKPDNIMVTARDHRAVVMDLGLAKLSDASRSITNPGGTILGTLRYMPPEQLQMDLVDIDRRADVYSLGATLFELVTGQPMFDGDTMPRLIEQVLRDRAPSAHSIASHVPKDLSAIIAKATEKHPRDRYGTAQAFAEDLDAFLHGRPIAARTPTLGYVLGLTIKRHPVRAALVVGALIAAVVGTGWFVKHQRDVRVREQQLRTAAETNLVRAEELNEFMLVDLGSDLEDFGRLGLLEKAANRAKEYYDTLPTEGTPWITLRGRGLVYERLADVFDSAHQPEPALQAARSALQIYASRLAEHPSDHDALLRWLRVRSTQSAVHLRQGALEESSQILDDIVARIRALDGPSPDTLSLLASSYGRIGEVHLQREKPDEAIRSHRSSLAVTQALMESGYGTHSSVLRLASDAERAIGEIMAERGEGKAAYKHFRRANELASNALQHAPGEAAALSAVARTAFKLGDASLEYEESLETAEAHYSLALKHFRTLAERDPGRPSSLLGLSSALDGLARIEEARDNPHLAALRSREAYDAAKRAASNVEDGEVLRVRIQRAFDLARRYRVSGQLDMAVARLREMRELIRVHVVREPDNVKSKYALFHALWQEYRIEESRDKPDTSQLADEALSIIAKLHEHDPGQVQYAGAYARALLVLGRRDDAADRDAAADEKFAKGQALAKAITSDAQADRSHLRILGELHVAIGHRHFEQDQYAQAKAAFERGARLAQQLGEPDNTLLGGAQRRVQFAQWAIDAKPFLDGARDASTDDEIVLLIKVQQIRTRYHPSLWVEVAKGYERMLPPVRKTPHPLVGNVREAVRVAARAAAQSQGTQAAAWVDRGLSWLKLHMAWVRAEDPQTLGARQERWRGDEVVAPLRADPRFEAALTTP